MTNFDVLGENVDKLITVDVRNRGVIHTLYDKTRNIYGSHLTLKAAQALHRAVHFGENVIIATGFPIAPKMVPETDGPLGALILSKALNIVLGAKTIMVAEKETLDLITVLARSIGLAVSKEISLEKKVALLSFPLDDKAALKHSISTIEEFHPSAIIAVEKVGGNHLGIHHNMRGNDISGRTIKADHLFREAERRGILTIGIGDGGNEIGMGKIVKTVREHVPYGAVCNCPCNAGIACETKTDYLVPATVSNWGAYGIVTCLSAINGQTEGLHSGKDEMLLLSEASREGAVDGITGKSTPSADGLNYNIHVHIVELLNELLRHSN